MSYRGYNLRQYFLFQLILFLVGNKDSVCVNGIITVKTTKVKNVTNGAKYASDAF